MDEQGRRAPQNALCARKDIMLSHAQLTAMQSRQTRSDEDEPAVCWCDPGRHVRQGRHDALFEEFVNVSAAHSKHVLSVVNVELADTNNPSPHVSLAVQRNWFMSGWNVVPAAQSVQARLLVVEPF